MMKKIIDNYFKIVLLAGFFISGYIAGQTFVEYPKVLLTTVFGSSFAASIVYLWENGKI